MRSTGRLRLAFVVVLACGVYACSDDAVVVTPVNARSAVTAGAVDAARLIGGSWSVPDPVHGVDVVIAERCGGPSAGLGYPRAGLVADGVSPTRAGTPIKSETIETTHVRIAVRVYADDAAARSAVERVGVVGVEGCVLAATNEFLATRTASDFESVAPASRSSFATSMRVSDGGSTRLITATFDEGVLGGSDNSHIVDVLAEQDGPAVITVVVASNGQIEHPIAVATLARRLADAARARTAARLH